MAKSTKKTERTHNATMIAGLPLHLANTTLVIDGQPMTEPEIVQRITARNAQLDDVTTARAGLTAAIAAERAARPDFMQFMGSLRSILVGMFRKDPKALADLDVAPRKTPAKPKSEVLAAAAKKAAATRLARHTMSKKQKMAIKGEAPAAAPSPAAPAPAASPVQTPAPLPSANGAPTQAGSPTPTHA